MLSLVTVSPVITAFHSCLSHHVFDQVNLWPAWVGFETAIFWQCSPGTVETQRLYPLRHGPRRATQQRQELRLTVRSRGYNPNFEKRTESNRVLLGWRLRANWWIDVTWEEEDWKDEKKVILFLRHQSSLSHLNRPPPLKSEEMGGSVLWSVIVSLCWIKDSSLSLSKMRAWRKLRYNQKKE